MTAIDDHRLASLQVRQIATRYPRLIGRNARLAEHGTGPITAAVTVRTDQGAHGWGLLCGAIEPSHELIGRPLADLFDPASGVLLEAALPLDLALHDLAGQILGLPVHALLGPTSAEQPPCYDGAIYLDDVEATEPAGLRTILNNCAADYAAGFRSFKLKIGRGHRWMDRDAGIRRDIAVTRAVREAYPDAQLLIDANDGYEPADFLGYLDAVRDCDLFWIEEPFPESQAALTALRDALGPAATLVADGETDPDLDRLLELAAAGLLDVLLMDIVTFGLTAWRRLMPTLVELGVAGSPHAWGVPLKTIYAGHVAAGLGNVAAVEGVPGVCVGVEPDHYRLRDGRLILPTGPGFGLTLTDE